MLGRVCFVVFFFKQKTAYEMRISDWSSDVCSSDLDGPERIAPEWWLEEGDADRATRDYYCLEVVGGRRFWVFRRGLYRSDAAPATDPAWYLHGLFA